MITYVSVLYSAYYSSVYDFSAWLDDTLRKILSVRMFFMYTDESSTYMFFRPSVASHEFTSDCKHVGQEIFSVDRKFSVQDRMPRLILLTFKSTINTRISWRIEHFFQVFFGRIIEVDGNKQQWRHFTCSEFLCVTITRLHTAFQIVLYQL